MKRTPRVIIETAVSESKNDQIGSSVASGPTPQGVIDAQYYSPKGILQDLTPSAGGEVVRIQGEPQSNAPMVLTFGYSDILEEQAIRGPGGGVLLQYPSRMFVAEIEFGGSGSEGAAVLVDIRRGQSVGIPGSVARARILNYSWSRLVHDGTVQQLPELKNFGFASWGHAGESVLTQRVYAPCQVRSLANEAADSLVQRLLQAAIFREYYA